MKTIKANLYSLISIIIEIFSILFMFFPIVEVVEQENIYIYHFSSTPLFLLPYFYNLSLL